MNAFSRDDGRALRVIQGFRQQALSNRPSFTPRPDWSDEKYAAAAHKKVRRLRQLLSEFAHWGGTLEGAEVLEVGCGAGIDCLLLGLQPVQRVVGIDLQLPLFDPGEHGEQTRRLTRQVLAKVGWEGDLHELLEKQPVRYATIDAARMPFPDDSFDFLFSRSAIEHIMPFEEALSEMARVVRPGGLLYHSTDPYFSLRGCHKTGVVDIPWAHARLSLEEFRRFVSESEGATMATKRCERLQTLNPFMIRQWRRILEAGPFEILDWREERSPLAEKLLEELPEVKDTLRDGVEERDLIHERLKVWLRKKRKVPGEAPTRLL